MVRRMFGFVYKEVRGLHQAAYILALFAFGSQILALVRDRILANQFGAGAELDIYYAAFRIPDLLYVLFASTLSVYVLIPFVARYKKEQGAEGAHELLSQVFTLFLVAYSTLAAACMIAAPYILPQLFPGIVDQALLTDVTRILLLQPFLLGISSLFGVITQLNQRFVLYAVSPLLYNIGIIFGIVVLYPWLGMAGIAMGVVLGAFGHMAVQWPLVQTSELRFGLVTRMNFSMLGTVLRVSIPRAITLSANQIVLLVLFGIASTMAIGSVAVFQFAFNLQSVPMAVIGVSYSVAAFPVLAELYAAKNHDRFAHHITTAIRHIIFWTVPATVLIVVLRAQIVRVVLGSGSFDWNDTRLTAAILATFVIALTSHAINLLLVRAFYAGGNTKIPLLVSLASGALAIGTAVWFVQIYHNHEFLQAFALDVLRVSDVAGTEILALAAGYSVVVVLQSIILLVLTARHFAIDFSWMWRRFGQAVFAGLLGGLCAYTALHFFVEGLNVNTFIGIFLQGLLAGLCGVAGVVAGYVLLGSMELKEVLSAFQKRIFKTNVVAPQKDIL